VVQAKLYGARGKGERGGWVETRKAIVEGKRGGMKLQKGMARGGRVRLEQKIGPTNGT